jgi:hypothetical protein
MCWFLLCVCVVLCVWRPCGGSISSLPEVLLIVAIVSTTGEVNLESEQTKGLEKKTDLF